MTLLKIIIKIRTEILEDNSCGGFTKYFLTTLLLIVELIVSVTLLTASIVKIVCSKSTVQKINWFFVSTIPGAITLAIIANILYKWLCDLFKI